MFVENYAVVLFIRLYFTMNNIVYFFKICYKFNKK
jgi:hypothetical protein